MFPTKSTPLTDAWSASEYNKVASFVYSKESTSPILSLLQPKSGEKIIDFGCGSGELDVQLSKIVSDEQLGKGFANGIVVGLDSSQSMIERARSNGLQHAHVADVQSLHNPESEELVAGLVAQHGKFNVVFSNAALHWCKRDPPGVLKSAKRVLRPGGRFVIEMGGWGNCIGVRSALHHVLRKRGYDPMARDPWFFPSEDSYRALLIAAGFEVTHISLTPRQTPLIGRLFDWLHMFLSRSSFFEGIERQEAEDMIKEVEDTCEIDCKDPSNDRWMIMYVRLRVSAVWNGEST